MKNRILNWLREYKSITTWEAFTELGCTRLSEYIRQLRLEYTIEDEWVSKKNRYGESVKFKKYMLKEDKNLQLQLDI